MLCRVHSECLTGDALGSARCDCGQQFAAAMFVELQITETEPGFKGDTATGATKPAIVETGATVYVPLFVEQGDVIKIDTRTGEYLSRV